MFNSDKNELKDIINDLRHELVELKNQVLPKYLVQLKLKNGNYVRTKEFNYEIYATSKQMAQQFIQFSGNSILLEDGSIIMMSEVSSYEISSMKRALNE